MGTRSSIPAGAPTRAEPQSFRASAMSVALTVKDLEKSLAWYLDVMGFTVDQRHEREGVLRAVSLKAGNVRILIGQDDGAKGWDRLKGEGLSIQFTTEQNVDQMAQRIKQRGVALHTEPTVTPWGARVFRVRDPDGFLLVITSPVVRNA